MKGSARFVASLVVGGAVLLFSSSALAQGGSKVKTTESEGDGDGYGYEFGDDPLSAGGFGPNDATIRVRPGPVRRTLIRPRTSFVPEMLKSVENL
jgi:hypothetical protein